MISVSSVEIRSGSEILFRFRYSTVTDFARFLG
jgi:hypothetical protein